MSKKKLTTKVPPVSEPKGKLHPANPMDMDLLEQIVKLMSANDLNTVDLRDGEKRVILKRGAVAPTTTYTATPTPTGLAASAASSSAPQPAPTPAPTPAPVEDTKLIPIKSPMVGTFYSAASPDSKPFVSIGSAVEEETEVCTIEAMKNFLPIKADTRGTIAKILVTNGQTVQFGQPLFLVKP
jgi:acetyl-CoA carboxylase biotin carboxyl carrier protein